MTTVYLSRYATRGDGVFGWLTVNGFRCFTVERPWLQNMAALSCVPRGTYKLALEFSPKFSRDLWELKGVPGRSEAKLHPANRATDLEGCIGLGEMIAQDGQGWYVTNSRQTVKAFHRAMGDLREASIQILDAPCLDTGLPKTSGGPT